MLIKKIKIAVCCMAVGFPTMMFSQKTSSETLNFIDAKGRRQGNWFVVNPDGMSFKGQFKDGKPYGRFEHFNQTDTSQIITVLEYFREGYAAKATHFHPNGKLRATGFYLDKIRDSTWEIYDTNGQIIERLNYLNGLKHGLSELFDKQGNLIETTEWYRDLRNGKWWQKTERGEQWTTYKLNYSHGDYEAHYANGNLYVKGVYEEGLKEKTWYLYHENALLDKVIWYKNNRIIKKQIAINVDDKDILIDSDSVGYMRTNGKITELKMLDETVYRPRQTFEQLVNSLGTDEFFMANSQFFAPIKLYDSMIEDEDNPMIYDTDNEDVVAEKKQQQRALLKLKISTPNEVYIDGEVIELLKSMTNTKPVK